MCNCPKYFLVFLSQLSSPICPVPAVLSRLSCPSCPVPTGLYQLSFTVCSPALSRLSCPGYTVPAVLSSAVLFLLSCYVLHSLPCRGCHATAILSSCPVLVVLSSLSCLGCHPTPSCPVQLSCTSCLVLSVLDQLYIYIYIYY